MRDHMAMRGPDGLGEWFSVDGSVGFGHRRLSIIDLSDAASQPMLSSEGDLVVTFNGEIYNFWALRKELEARGHVFRTTSDTEVLLHLYAEKGEAMVHDLRGMFAFAIWDARKRALFLARDPYGIKPLYYADDGRTFRFASSVKALLAGGEISREPDPAGIVGFYLFGSVPEPFTTYRAIRSVPAGTTLVVEPAGPRHAKSFFSIAEVYRDAEAATIIPEVEIEERIRRSLFDSVKHHMVADVPVGAFLSGGVDSAAIVGLMRDVGQKEISTVTLAFKEFAGTQADEAPFAERVAKYYGTHHTTRWIGSAEFCRDLPAIVDAMDQPSIDGVNTWFVSKAARELGLKVAVSGIGGDELFGGYGTFHSIPRLHNLLRTASQVEGLGVIARRCVSTARALGFRIHPKYAGLLTYGGTFAGTYLLQRGLFLPFELACVLDDEAMIREGLSRLRPIAYVDGALRNGPNSAFGKTATLESCLYLRNQLLRDTDWAGMAHSLEIRTPFVDHELLRQVSSIVINSTRPSGKKLLAAAPVRRIPAAVVERTKTGFGIPIQSLLGELPADATTGSRAHNDVRLWSRTWARAIGARLMDLKHTEREPDRLLASS